MSGKRKRSSFRRGGVPYGVDGRNRAAIALGKRQGRQPFGQGDREREAADAIGHLVSTAEMEARMRAMEGVLLPATASVIARIQAVGEEVGELLFGLSLRLPREVEVTVVGMTDSPVQMRAEVLEGTPTGTAVLVLPSSLRR